MYWYFETGWFEHDKQGEQIIPTGHWIRESEASFEETLELVQKINPRAAIATHIGRVEWPLLR